MTDDEQPCSSALPEQQKAIFVGRVLIVKELNCEFVVENRLGFLEGNTVLPEVRGGLGRIPFKPDHQYIVFMNDCVSSCAVTLSYAGEQPDVAGVLAVYPFSASEKYLAPLAIFIVFNLVFNRYDREAKKTVRQQNVSRFRPPYEPHP